VPSRSIQTRDHGSSRLADFEKTMAKLVSKGPARKCRRQWATPLAWRLASDKKIGKHIVPIVPMNRGRRMEPLRQVVFIPHVANFTSRSIGTKLAFYKGAKTASSSRKHHRGRLDVVVHRAGTLTHARREHDPHVIYYSMFASNDRRFIWPPRCPRESFILGALSAARR